LLREGRADDVVSLMGAVRPLSPALREARAVALLHLGRSDPLVADLPYGPYRTVALGWHGSGEDWATLGYADLVVGRPHLALGALRRAVGLVPSGETNAVLGWAQWGTGDSAATRATLNGVKAETDMTVSLRALLAAHDGQGATVMPTLRAWGEMYSPGAAFW